MVHRLSVYLLGVVLVVPLLAAPLHAQVLSQSAPYEPKSAVGQIVVLKNGEVLSGRVIASDDRILLALPGGEITLRINEIDVVANSIADAYLLKRAKTRPTDIDGRLDLTAWCMRHNLLAEASNELAAVSALQPFNSRLAVMRRRHQKLLDSADTAAATSADTGHRTPVEVNLAQMSSNDRRPPKTTLEKPFSWPLKRGESERSKKNDSSSSAANTRAEGTEASTATLERFVRSLPAQSVEQFTSSMQPMITRGCATAGCHAPGNSTGFTLLRLPQGQTASRRLTQRNLYNTVQLVDFSKPETSRLLKVASEPHGPLKSGSFGDYRSPKYRELRSWIATLTGTPLPGNPSTIEQTIFDAPVPAAESSDPSFNVAPGHAPAQHNDPLEPNQPAHIRSPLPAAQGARDTGSRASRSTRKTAKRGGTAAPQQSDPLDRAKSG